jgi:hypothetical protein
MKNLLLHVDSILRGEATVSPATRSRHDAIVRGMLIAILVMLYGGVMGSWGLFAATAGDQWLASLYSATKAPLLLVATFLLSLPVLFVFYTLAGLRADFARVIRSLLEMQAALSIVLGGLAPFTLLWYASSSSYEAALLFNALMFAVATLAAPLLMRRHYRPLVERDPRHRPLLRLWIVLYIFIGVQMAWVLRPFIGSPGTPISFFRSDIDNAYVNVAEIVWNAVAK